MRDAFAMCNNIKKIMKAVNEVNIGHAAFGIHYFSAVCEAVAMGVAGLISSACVCFRFYYHAAGNSFFINICKKKLAQKLAANLYYVISAVKRIGNFAHICTASKMLKV